MHIDQVGVNVLSTPTPSEEGLGRQPVDTGLVNMWTGMTSDATSIGNMRGIWINLVSTFCLPQPLPKRVGVDNVETDLVNIWIGVACDATNIGHLLCI